MSQTQVIGRVAVKVLPDTKDFRKRAQALLSKEERGLKVNVDAQINENSLKSAALKAVNNVNKAIKGKDHYKVRFHATFSVPSLRQAVVQASRDLEALAKTEKIKFGADIAATIAEVEAVLEQTSLKKVEHELKDWVSDISPMQVDIAPTMLPGASTYVSTRLRYLTRPRSVEIIPKINNSAFAAAATAIAALSGGRVLHDALDGIWQRLKRLDKMVPIIGTLAEAIAGLGAYGMTAASNLFALSMSLAQIGQAGLALPGILGGMAIGLGASFAVLKDFNKVIPEVADKLHRLQDQMSEKFWSVAEKPIREMIGTLFPQLSAGLQKTSTELGGFFANLAKHGEGQFNGALAGMFDDLSKSIAIAGQHTEAFMTIIRVLGEVGAGYLPQLAGWFGDISDRFANFLSKAQADGSMKDWIDTGVFQLKELGRALGELGGIFAGLARAAQQAGGSTLSMFADTLERVHNTIDGDTFQTALVGSLQAAHQAMSLISNGSGQQLQDLFLALAKTSETVFPIMGQTVGKALGAIFSALSQASVQNGLVAMFSGLQQAVSALAPAMGPVGDALGALMQVVGALAANLGPILAVAFTTLGSIIGNLSGPIMTLIDMLGGGLLSIIQAVAPPLVKLGQQLGEFFTNTLLPALQPVITFISELASAVLPMLIAGVGQVITAITPLVVLLGQLFQVVGPILIPVLKFLASVIIDSIVMAVQGAVQFIMGFVSVLTGLWNFISGVFTGNWSKAWDGIKQIFGGIWDMIVGAFKVAINVGIFGVAKKILTAVKAFFKGCWRDIWQILKGLWDSIKDRFVNFLKDIFKNGKNVLTAIKNFFKGVWNDIKAAISLAWDAIKSRIGGSLTSVKNTVSSGFSRVKQFISDAMSRAWGLVKAGWDKVRGFFSGGVGDVITKVGELPGKIRSAMSGAGQWLLSAGQKIIQGLIDGIGQMFGKVRDKLGELTGKLTDWKGPESRDRVLLTGAGQLIMDSFITGLESRYDAVRKSLKGLTREVASTQFDAPGFNGPRSNGLTAHLAAVVNGNASEKGSDGKTLNYYAAPGSSIDAEEDLFAATNRARMVGW